jgi:hypothetical protein
MNQCPQEDNTDNWQSFTFHIDDNNAFPTRADAAGPGYWNDLDFLMVGWKELKEWETPQTLAEYRSQFSLFAILAAPLIFSADIRGTQNGTFIGHNGVHHSTFNGWTPELATILLNKAVIAVRPPYSCGTFLECHPLPHFKSQHHLPSGVGHVSMRSYMKQIS